MTLRDLGVFDPLPHDHPLIGEQCWFCECTFVATMRVGLLPRETLAESGSFTVGCDAVCGTCLLRGTGVGTPSGPRILSRIKNGDGSPYPVETADGRQWRADEVCSLKG